MGGRGHLMCPVMTSNGHLVPSRCMAQRHVTTNNTRSQLNEVVKAFSGMMTYLPVIQVMSHASCSEGFTQLAWQVRLELLVGCIHLDDRGWLGWLGVNQGLQR